MKRALLFTSILLALTTTMCKQGEEGNAPYDGNIDVIIISTEEYQESPAAPLTIHSIELEGDSLTIKFWANGCDGETWETRLIGADRILEGEDSTIERSLRLSLENNEECDANITKTLTFDIQPFQVENYNTIVLRIRDYKPLITYNY